MKGQFGRWLGLIQGENQAQLKMAPYVLKTWFLTGLETFWPPAPMTEEFWYGKRIRASGQRWPTCLVEWTNCKTSWLKSTWHEAKAKIQKGNSKSLIADLMFHDCKMECYLHFLFVNLVKAQILCRFMNTQTTIAAWTASSGLLMTLAWWVS